MSKSLQRLSIYFLIHSIQIIRINKCMCLQRHSTKVLSHPSVAENIRVVSIFAPIFPSLNFLPFLTNSRISFYNTSRATFGHNISLECEIILLQAFMLL